MKPNILTPKIFLSYAREDEIIVKEIYDKLVQAGFKVWMDKVNLIAGQAGITGGAGAVGANTPRVTVASDDPLLVETQDSLQDYFLDDFDDSGNPLYIGYQDKGGNYYIQRINTSTGAVDYTKGASGYSTAWTNRATESYNDFATTF